MRNRIRGACVLALAAVSLSGCGWAASRAPGFTATVIPASPATISPGDSERMLTIAGMERSYFLHVPPDLAADQPLPLVLIFHGLSGDGESIMRTTGFSPIADGFGFLVVYPEGTGPSGAASWNAGGCCGYAKLYDIDEPEFIRGILSNVGTIARIDSKRIYSAGFSNGAMLAYRLACEMSDTFAAVAPVAGVLLNTPCNPNQPVSVLHIHGLAESSVPYSGSTTPAASGGFESVDQSIAAWVMFDGCPSNPAISHDGLAAHTSYGPCKNGTAVELFAIQGIGHAWPPDSIFPTSRTIWNFLVAHPKP